MLLACSKRTNLDTCFSFFAFLSLSLHSFFHSCSLLIQICCTFWTQAATQSKSPTASKRRNIPSVPSFLPSSSSLSLSHSFLLYRLFSLFPLFSSLFSLSLSPPSTFSFFTPSHIFLSCTTALHSPPSRPPSLSHSLAPPFSLSP